MAVHDWTRVSQGILHHFHNAWTLRLADLLNGGVLPPHVYALSEQVAGETAPDIIALELIDGSTGDRRERTHPGPAPAERSTSATSAPPRTSIVARTEDLSYAALRRTIVIRHVENHEVVALIEIVSRANKASRAELARFLANSLSALKQHVHLVLVDLYPPGRLDPQGMHGAIWSALGQDPPGISPEKPLVAAGYEAGAEVTAYVEPFAVGDPLPDIPLFLEIGAYVNVPLETAYAQAFESVPAYWRRQIEG